MTVDALLSRSLSILVGAAVAWLCSVGASAAGEPADNNLLFGRPCLSTTGWLIMKVPNGEPEPAVAAPAAAAARGAIEALKRVDAPRSVAKSRDIGGEAVKSSAQ